jgi:phenylalanyl-tRNA synthetase alpha chain
MQNARGLYEEEYGWLNILTKSDFFLRWMCPFFFLYEQRSSIIFWFLFSFSVGRDGCCVKAKQANPSDRKDFFERGVRVAGLMGTQKKHPYKTLFFYLFLMNTHTSSDVRWIEVIRQKLLDPTLSISEKAYYQRMLRLLDMPNLTEQEGHPISMVVRSITNAPFFREFEMIHSPEIVSERETFDLFEFPEHHVARRPSDSYFIRKSPIKTESMLLRPHTTVMWYHALLGQGGKEKLEREGEVRFLSWGKVYRVDELDTTHHECFHQIDGLCIVAKEREVMTQQTLRDVLTATIESLFGKGVKFRFNEDHFPYTLESLEVEVEFDGKWIEVLGAGIVHPDVLAKLGIDGTKYNGWAFGFGIERLVMPLKKVPDIRIFWSTDPRITSQWGSFVPYKPVSIFPAVYKDISMIVPKSTFIADEKEKQKSGEFELTRETESNFFAITGVIRDVSGDLIESVKITDMFENDGKFGPEQKSMTIRIMFRSLERTLTNDEINVVYFQIREKIEGELGYVLR